MVKTRNNTKTAQQASIQQKQEIEEKSKLQKKEKKIKKVRKQQKKYPIQQSKTCMLKQNILEKQVSQQIQQQIPIQFIQHSQNDYICSICLNYIVKAITTQCSHSFCQICLSEYFLFFQECNQCGIKIRKSKFSYNIVLDSLIESYISKFHIEELQEFKARTQSNKKWALTKKPEVLQVGAKLDILDPNYIWCEATIYRTICKWQQNRTKYIFIKYEGKQKSYNEQICENSARIATHGFYTKREDIPRYQKGNYQLKLNEPIIFNTQEELNYIKKIEFDINQ